MYRQQGTVPWCVRAMHVTVSMCTVLRSACPFPSRTHHFRSASKELYLTHSEDKIAGLMVPLPIPLTLPCQAEKSRELSLVRAEEEDKIATALARRTLEKQRKEKEIQQLREQSSELREWVPGTSISRSAASLSSSHISLRSCVYSTSPSSHKPRSLVDTAPSTYAYPTHVPLLPITYAD